jgi:WD40 repeat protein
LENLNLFATASSDKTIKIVNPENDQIFLTFKGHTGAVHKLQYFSEDKKLLSCGDDGTVRIWDIYNPENHQIYVTHENSIRSICILDDQKQFISGGSDKVLKIWNTSSFQRVGQFHDPD